MGVQVDRAFCNQPHRLICQHICPSVPEQEYASRVLCGPARMLAYRICQEAIILRYEEFRDRFEDALQEMCLFIRDAHRVGTIGLADTVRRWKVYIIRAAPRSAEPFQVSAEIGFGWTPVDAARAYTCEEDLLMQLISGEGDRLGHRSCGSGVDLSLRANLLYGSKTSMPEPRVFGAWSASIVKKAHDNPHKIEERQGQIVAVLGGHGDLEVQAQCKPDGVVSLNGVAISGFRMVRVPIDLCINNAIRV